MSLALAAIDGILCAFVAILAFSMILLDTPAQAPRDINKGMLILSFDKSGETPMLTQLALTVSDTDAAGGVVRGAAAPAPDGSPSPLLWEKGTDRAIAVWQDCISTAYGSCVSRLVMTGVAPNARFMVMLRTSSESGKVGGANSLILAARTVPASSHGMDPFAIDASNEGYKLAITMKDGVPTLEPL